MTKLALDEAIKICGPGVPYSEIGKVIHGIADKHKYGVVRDFVGHGVGQLFHSAPTIVHYRNNYPGVMQVSRPAWHQCPWHHAVTDAGALADVGDVMHAELQLRPCTPCAPALSACVYNIPCAQLLVLPVLQ